MTSARPYQGARSVRDALRECIASAGTHLCPATVEALEGCWEALAEVRAERTRVILV